MRFNRLEIDNFMAIGEITIDIDNKGLVLIEGENFDDDSANSNGSGKSSIVNALQWSIYNITDREDTGDAVVNRTAKKNTRVLTQIVDDDRTYNVIRHRKHKDHKNRVLLLDVTDRENIIDLTQASDKATQLHIEKIVGCSAEVFNAAIMCGQEAQIDLPKLTDKQLKLIVEEAAGIDKMQEAYRIARERYGVKKGALYTANHQQELLTTEAAAISTRLESYKNKSVEFDDTHTAKIKEVEADIAAGVAEVKAIKTQLDDIAVDALKAELETITGKIESVDEEHRQHKALSDQLSDLNHQLTTGKRDFATDKQAAEKLKTKLENVLSEIGTACKSCGSTITKDSVEHRRHAIAEQIREQVTAAKGKMDTVQTVTVAIEQAQSELSAFEATMTDTSSLVERQKVIQSELDTYSRIVAEIRTKTAALKGKQGTIKTLREETNPYHELIATEQGKLTANEEKQGKQAAEIEQAKQALQVAGCTVDVFSPSGIRAHILDTVTPFLNDRTARYLGVLSDGNIHATWSTLSKTAKGELREKFQIGVVSLTGGGSYKSLSGGEKRKVRLATALALQDLVSSRATKPIELWIGDEIDDAVDVSGLERLMTVLEEKAKEKGTVLIISHNSIGDWVRQHATVTKSRGMATMTGVLNIDRTVELV